MAAPTVTNSVGVVSLFTYITLSQESKCLTKENTNCNKDVVTSKENNYPKEDLNLA